MYRYGPHPGLAEPSCGTAGTTDGPPDVSARRIIESADELMAEKGQGV